MAGGRLEASYDNSGIQASFVAYADFLIAWDPFHYDIDAGVTVSAGFQHPGVLLRVRDDQRPGVAGRVRSHPGPASARRGQDRP